MKSVLLLDMDEVIVDFVGGAARLHGLTKEKLMEIWEPGTWSIVGPVGAALGLTLSTNQFWQPIHDAGSAFWEYLSECEWASGLIEAVEATGLDWHVVTAPSLCPTSYDGKVKWLKRRFGKSFDRFIITPHKELLAKPSHILIDDRRDNVVKFREAGGRAFLFPSYGNQLYRHANNPLPWVENLLERSLSCTSK